MPGSASAHRDEDSRFWIQRLRPAAIALELRMGCAARFATSKHHHDPKKPGLGAARRVRVAARAPAARSPPENHEIDASPTPERPPGARRRPRAADRCGRRQLTGPSPNEYRETGMAETPAGRRTSSATSARCASCTSARYELPCCRQSACAGCLGDFYKRPVGEGVLPAARAASTATRSPPARNSCASSPAPTSRRRTPTTRRPAGAPSPPPPPPPRRRARAVLAAQGGRRPRGDGGRCCRSRR